MKLVLPLLILFGLLSTTYGEFRAGAASSNITPGMGVPLDGAIMQTGPAKDIHDELWARCLVLSDGTSKLAIVIVDNTMISREIFDEAKRRIEIECGIPSANVCLAATHSHSTPRGVVGLVDSELHRDYLDFLAVRIADGVKRADNRLVPAEAGWGSFEEPRFVHNRRWFVRNPVKSPFGEATETILMNPGKSADLDRPTGPVDSEFFVFAVRRKTDQKPIALLGNYGLHYVGGVPGGTVSADYFGSYADAIQKRWSGDHLDPPFVGMLSNGTSGDVNAIDFKAPRVRFEKYERMNGIAAELADKTQALLETVTYSDVLPLRSVASELELKVRKPGVDRLEWAGKNRAPENTKFRLPRPQIYAREALHLANFPDVVSVPLQVFRIGDLAVVQSPCETFAETGLAIKAGSPFADATFTIELANGYFGYLPPENQFQHGGYETWPARSSFLEESAETKIRAELLRLLSEINR
ncbi:MAG: neutral/alkaline non-lysosomal ceramidase N-terminal domain-containing protein [Verrucomicrobiales bacterium]|nr:neutral/alkaline non-lysosomal ceramidase N-terminal domain-containing protein [Verrucomicrobiales bacterium]